MAFGPGAGRLFSRGSVALLVPSLWFAAAQAQTAKAPDITRTPTLYVVDYAHLDTQWRWEFPQTISQFLLKTMRVNFGLIDTYPHYIFNWTGANRYRLMKEYFPADYERMKGYVAAGRWFPAGSSVEEGDVNLPSAEGLFRQVLYGNAYFDDEFGKHSNEYMLPDCFGFPASLPTILTHAGVKGFSTQKLSAAWQPAPLVGGPDSPEQTPEGIPFNVGRWIGPDGSTVIAALNPGNYGSQVFDDLSKTPPPFVAPVGEGRRGRRAEQDWVSRIAIDGKVTGVYADYHYVGTGDVGGATTEESVKLLEATVTHGMAVLPGSSKPVQMGDGPVHVIETPADQLFNDLTPAETAHMPSVTGDLELINHSAGSLTSQAWHKQQVLKNEVLADAAEKSSVAAAWLGARSYPQARMNLAWMLALGGHFHDTAAGTATPKAYEYAWNDDAIVRNEFKNVLNDATAGVVASMDTRGPGVPLVVFNVLNVDREDVVEARLPDALAGGAVGVTDAAGRELPAQVAEGKVLFVARVPSVGFAVFHVKAMPRQTQGFGPSGELKVSANTLENAHYKVTVNAAGDVSSVFDKGLGKELLAAPMRLAISNDNPRQWPAWNMDFDQEQAAPRAYVSGPVQMRIAENGPARVALEITRQTEGSTFVQTVSLAAGAAGERVVFGNSIDWRGKSSNLKAVFALTAANKQATYSWDVGTVERPNAAPRQFEVGSHRWIDLTDASGGFGATVLTGYKNASDKPADNTVRLTLLRTPGIQPGAHAYTDQANQDWGHHEFSYGLAGHKGDWRAGGTDWQANALATPMLAFTTEAHPGALGNTFSLVKVDNPRVRVLAVKKAERSDEVIVRLVELDGRPTGPVRLTVAGGVSAAREVNGQEQPVGAAQVNGGALVTRFAAYQPRTFAVTLAAPARRGAMPASEPVALHYDLAAASNDDTAVPAGGFDGAGDAYPAEMLPESVRLGAVKFQLGAAKTGAADAVVARGQTLALPGGPGRRIYLLAASSNGDQKASFQVDGKPVQLTIQAWNGKIGQWDTREWKPGKTYDWAISANHAVFPAADDHAREQYTSPRFPEDYVSLKPGYTKPAEVAWFASHQHTAAGLNQPYEYSYLFAYAIDTPAGAKTLTLPNNEAVRVFAVSTGGAEPQLQPAFLF